MAVTDELIVKIRAETADLRKGLARVNKTLDRTTTKANAAGTAMRGMTRILALVGAAAAARGIVNSIRMFEDLEATIQANTKSATETAAAMQMIRKFTAETTFQLQEVTAAFIEFRRLGIKPTEEQLRGIGNVAASQGVGIEQVASAIFKAGTTSIEGLQQLGAVVVTNGDKLTITIAGVTETIDKNTDSVLKFIAKVGKTKFDTAIADRAKTLTGALSNLGDATAEAAVTIGNAGLSKVLVTLIKDIRDELSGSNNMFESIGRFLANFLLTLQKIVQTFTTTSSAISLIGAKIENVYDKMRLSAARFGGESEEQLAFVTKLHLKFLESQKTLNDEMKGFNREVTAISDFSNFVFAGSGDPIIINAGGKDDNDGKGKGTPVIPETTAELKTIKGVFDSMAQSITATSAAFTDKFVSGLMEGKNALSGFASFAKDIVKQIISTFIQMAIVNKILNSVFGLGGTTGELATFTPKFAGGGTVQAGQPTLVGERGAEIFVPNSSGRIMNNADSQGAGGGGVVINQNINFSTGVVGQVRSELAKLMPQISDTTKAAVLEASQRGGSFRKGLMGA